MENVVYDKYEKIHVYRFKLYLDNLRYIESSKAPTSHRSALTSSSHRTRPPMPMNTPKDPADCKTILPTTGTNPAPPCPCLVTAIVCLAYRYRMYLITANDPKRMPMQAPTELPIRTPILNRSKHSPMIPLSFYIFPHYKEFFG